MSVVREHLAAVVAKKVEAHGAVVWEDPEGEYIDVADSVCPRETRFTRWDGSWYALRRELEELVDGPTAPRLLIYQPTETPGDDPLAEVRNAGTLMRHRLATLVRDSLSGTLTQDRIAELAQGSRTLPEVEAALSSGAQAGVRLPAALGSADTIELSLRILADGRLDDSSDSALWDEARSLLEGQFGISEIGPSEEAIEAAFRHLVVTELTTAAGGPLPGLDKASAPVDASQRARISELLTTWRRDRLRLSSYRGHAATAQAMLSLGNTLEWQAAFEQLDSVEVLDDLALAEVARRVSASEIEPAAALARLRQQRSMWTDGQLPEAARWVPAWKAAVGVTDLLLELSQPTAQGGSVEGVLAGYVRDGWRIDAAHRQMEEALTQLPASACSTKPCRWRGLRSRSGWTREVRRLTDAVASGRLRHRRARRPNRDPSTRSSRTRRSRSRTSS